MGCTVGVVHCEKLCKQYRYCVCCHHRCMHKHRQNLDEKQHNVDYHFFNFKNQNMPISVTRHNAG